MTTDIHSLPAIHVNRIWVQQEGDRDRIRMVLGEQDGAGVDRWRDAFMVTPDNAAAWGAVLIKFAGTGPLQQATALVAQLGPDGAKALADVMGQLCAGDDAAPSPNRATRRARKVKPAS